jgi:FMN phosphatase YigB (HAD superfamily)
MIGDRLDNDIIPAKQLGMHTIWVKQGFGGMADIKNTENIADHTVKSIGEILSYL